MGKITYSIEIDGAVEDVFEYMTEPEQIQRWVGGLVEMEALTNGGSQVGAKSRQVFLEHGRRIEVMEEVLVFEPNRRVKIKAVTDGFWLTAEYVLEAVNGGTRIDYEAETHLESWLMKLMGPLVHRSSRQKVVEDFGRLKGLVEGKVMTSAAE